MSETTAYRHPKLPISAPCEWWSACGYSVYTNGTVGHGWYGFETVLILALAAGKTDADAVAWALAEWQRRQEEERRINAIQQEAAALRELAVSIRSSTEESVLEKIMGRLTERTRYAVRSQLK